METRDIEAETWTRKLVQANGWAKAYQLAHEQRDNNSPGSFTFAYWNRTCKALDLFRTVEPPLCKGE